MERSGDGEIQNSTEKLNAEDAEDAEGRRGLQLEINHCSGQVVDAAMKVHTALGPGLLESAYEACLAYELRRRGLQVAVQSPVEVVYGSARLPVAYRIDLLVNDSVVVELKTVSKLKRVHEAQLLSYLRLSGHRLGLLINFNVVHLRNGIRRIANEL